MSHHHEHAGHEHHDHGTPPKYAGLHKDWRAWLVVVLMLAGMAIYILSLNEEDQPAGEGDGQPVPAAVE